MSRVGQEMYPGASLLLPHLRNGFPAQELRSHCPALPKCLRHFSSLPYHVSRLELRHAVERA